jgi:hypothetical protein
MGSANRPVNWDDNPDSETFGEVTMYSFTELPVDGNFDARPGESSTSTLIA